MRTRTRRAVDRFNAYVLGLRASPRFGKVVSRRLTVVTYTGRRSGTTFSIPVGYRRAGGVVRIGVRLRDAKGWWRNFTGDGAPLTAQLDGVDRSGRGLAHRDAKGRVTVRGGRQSATPSSPGRTVFQVPPWPARMNDEELAVLDGPVPFEEAGLPRSRGACRLVGVNALQGQTS